MSNKWKKEESRTEIKGFWNREEGNDIEGILIKKVTLKDDNAFYLVKLLSGPVTIDDKGKPGKAGKDDVIGVSAMSAVETAFDDILTRGEPYAVKVISHGKKPHPKDPKKTLWEMEVFSMTAKEANIPF